MENILKKVYSYQKRFTYIEAPLYSFIISLFILSWFPAVIAYYVYGVIYPSTIRFGLFLNISSTISIFVIALIKSDFKKTMFAITDDAIIFKAPGKLRTINFSDITLCKHTQTPFRNFIQITSAQRNILLPFSINGIHDLILHLHERLIANGKTTVLDESSPGSMISEALVHKKAYLREKTAFFPLIVSTLFLTFFDLLMAYKFWELDLIAILIWAIIGFLIPLNVFAFAEFLINQLVKKTESPDNKGICQSNPEGSYYLLSILLFLMIYFSLGILIKFTF